jgi:hypothetical protein
MNTSSRNTVDIATSVNATNDHRAETTNPSAVGLWQKAIDANAQTGGAPVLAMPTPQKGPNSGPGVAPDVLQQSQFLSRFGGATTTQGEVTEQGGILAQVGAASDQADALDQLLGDAAAQGGMERDTDAAGSANARPDFGDLDDDLDATDAAADMGATELNEHAGSDGRRNELAGAGEVARAATPEMRDAQKFTNLVERFADRFLMELDAGAAKQMHVDLGRGLIPDASLVLQQAGGGWTLRAQTRTTEAGEKLKLAESTLKERFRARGLGEITIDVEMDQRETMDASEELV